jgi:uncharacterized membrane protein
VGNDTSSSSGSWSFPLPPSGPEPRPGCLGYLRSRFVTGAIVAFPLVVTIFFARFIFNLLDRWSYPITARLLGYSVPGVGAAIAIVLVFLLGVLAHNVLGRRILRVGERILSRVPFVRPVYTGAREITKAFTADRSKAFRRVVLIPFPSRDAMSIAFLTAEFEQRTAAGAQPMVSVFMPTTPNFTTGFYLIYPAAVVQETSLTVEEAIRMVISGGLLAPSPDRILSPPPPPPREPT